MSDAFHFEFIGTVAMFDHYMVLFRSWFCSDYYSDVIMFALKIILEI